jgi:hypothetical protein
MEKIKEFKEMSNQLLHKQLQETNKYKGMLEQSIHATEVYKQSVD